MHLADSQCCKQLKYSVLGADPATSACWFCLQAEYAAKDASASNSRRSSSSGSQPQQQQVQELLQQVADLQQQLAAATTARAAASAAVAVAGGSRMQQQAGDTQEQQAHADALQEEVQQLQAALEDRTLELQEWQIHADVSDAEAVAHNPRHTHPLCWSAQQLASLACLKWIATVSLPQQLLLMLYAMLTASASPHAQRTKCLLLFSSWQCCFFLLLQALEKDLEDLKAQVLAAEGLQGELEGTQAQLAAARSQQQQLQQDLEQARGNMSQLKYELHGELCQLLGVLVRLPHHGCARGPSL